MFALPHTSTLKGKFNWYEWPACVYETDQEVAEAIQNNACFGKTLRRIKVIGESRISTTNQSRFKETEEDVRYVTGIYADEPVVFEFDDGSTIELLLQRNSLIRIGFNSIPNQVIDGLRTHNGNFEKFFKSFLNLFIGKKLKTIKIETIRNDDVIFSFDNQKSTTDNLGDPEIKFYRFIFEGGFTISLKNSEFGGYLIQIYFPNTSKLSRPFNQAELVKFDNSFSPRMGDGWFFGGYADYDIYPEIIETKTPLGSFLASEVLLCCDEEDANAMLKTFWEIHLPNGGRFVPWECHVYDYNTMHAMIEHIQNFIFRIENNCMNDEDKTILEKAVNMSSHCVESQSNDQPAESKPISPSPMECFIDNREFMLQFCEYVSAMMRSCPNAQYICIQGP